MATFYCAAHIKYHRAQHRRFSLPGVIITSSESEMQVNSNTARARAHFFHLALKRGKWIWYRPKPRDINAHHLAASRWKEWANHTAFSFSVISRLFRISGWCFLFILSRNKIKINNGTRTKLCTAHFLFQNSITFQVHCNLGKESLGASQRYRTNHNPSLPCFFNSSYRKHGCS